MMYRDVIRLTIGKDEVRDVTDIVQEIVGKSGVEEGMCHISIKGTTSGLLVNENDRMLLEDFRNFYKKVIPDSDDKIYQHPENAHSHLRAGVMKSETTLPVSNRKLLLGTWQSIMIWNFDVRERERDVVVTVVG